MSKTLTLPIIAHLLLVRDNKILLFRRKKQGVLEGYFCAPCGKIDDNETPSQAIIREAHEEIGLTLKSVTLATTVYYNGPSLMANLNAYSDLGLFFKPIGDFAGEPYNKEPDKHDEFKWYDLDTGLPDKLLPTVKKGIELLKAGSTYGECLG